jgi:hypothetical protein
MTQHPTPHLLELFKFWVGYRLQSAFRRCFEAFRSLAGSTRCAVSPIAEKILPQVCWMRLAWKLDRMDMCAILVFNQSINQSRCRDSRWSVHRGRWTLFVLRECVDRRFHAEGYEPGPNRTTCTQTSYLLHPRLFTSPPALKPNTCRSFELWGASWLGPSTRSFFSFLWHWIANVLSSMRNVENHQSVCAIVCSLHTCESEQHCRIYLLTLPLDFVFVSF